MRVPILMYHWFDVPGSSGGAGPQFAIKPSAFRRHMEWLVAGGWGVVGIDDLAAALRGGPPLPRRPIAITFDDAYDDFYEHALPVITELGLKVTLYVPSGLVGRSNLWDQARGEPERSIMAWTRLREVADAGVDIGAHSVTHPDMRTLDDAGLADELSTSRKQLEDGLGRSVTSFAYPYGYYDERAKQAARASGYTAACAVLFRLRDLLRSDRFALQRVIVHANKSFNNFKMRALLAAPRHREG